MQGLEYVAGAPTRVTLSGAAVSVSRGTLSPAVSARITATVRG